MNLTKDNIKTWLKRSGKDREWLGEQLGVNKRTVDNWLSIQDIPDGKLRLIERLMADDAAEEARQKQLSNPTNQVFSVEVSHGQFRRYSAAALTCQQTLEDWCITTLDAMAEDISAGPGLALESISRPSPLRTQAASPHFHKVTKPTAVSPAHLAALAQVEAEAAADAAGDTSP